MKGYSLLLLIAASMMYACKDYGDENFMSSIEEIEFDAPCIQLGEDTLVMDGIYTGAMWAKDSLLFFFSSKFPDYRTYVFNKNTQKHVASLFPKGNAPHEYPYGVSVTWDVHSLNNGDWGLWFYDNISEYRLVNMNHSVCENKTVVDSVIPFDFRKNHTYPFGNTYFLENKMLGRMQCVKKYYTDKEYVPVEYFVYPFPVRNEDYEKIIIYDDCIPQLTNSELSEQDYFNSWDEYNHTQHKIAMGMCRIPQVNIVDVATGKVKGYRLKGGCSFNDLSMQTKCRTYYRGITTNSKYIFLLYADGKEECYPAYSQIIHVMDWEGNPVAELKVPSPVGYIFLDAGTNILYGQDDEDNYYCYDLSRYGLF